jgi:hypothetical protein
MARGPGQAADVPATTAGIPIRLDSAGQVSKVAFELHYDPALLNITGVQLPAGGTLTPDASPQPGVVKVEISFASPVAANGLIVARLIGQVPGNAPYGAKHVLDLRNVVVNDGGISVRADDGLHVVVFAGDASGNAGYSTLDIQRLQRVMLGADTGFSAWPSTDPAIIGDVNNNGSLTIADSTLLSREILGFDRPEIPPLPATPPSVFFSGPDPLVNLPRGLSVRAGDLVSVPVNLDTAAGLEAVQLRLAYDVSALELVSVGRGKLTGDFQWFVQRNSPGVLVMDMTRLTSLTGGTGSLLELQFRAKATSEARDVLLDLQWASLNEGRLTLNPAPRAGADPTDGLLRILPRALVVPHVSPLEGLEMPRAVEAQPSAQAPVIDFSLRYGTAKPSSQGEGQGTGGWKAEFVTELARNDEERNPNGRLRITSPAASKVVHRPAPAVRPDR